MSDIFREVDEDVRRQEVEHLLRRYGPLVAGGLLLAVVAYLGYYWWESQRDARLAAAGDGLLAGLELQGEGQFAEALVHFNELAENAPAGYRLMSQLQIASTSTALGNSAAAIDAYDAIAADRSFDAVYRDLARLYAGYVLIEMDAPLEELGARLNSVAQGSGPWRFHANEALGFAALRAGDYEQAIEHLRLITDDGSAPEGVAQRADEMLNVATVASGPASAGE